MQQLLWLIYYMHIRSNSNINRYDTNNNNSYNNNNNDTNSNNNDKNKKTDLVI